MHETQDPLGAFFSRWPSLVFDLLSLHQGSFPLLSCILSVHPSLHPRVTSSLLTSLPFVISSHSPSFLFLHHNRKSAEDVSRTRCDFVLTSPTENRSVGVEAKRRDDHVDAGESEFSLMSCPFPQRDWNTKWVFWQKEEPAEEEEVEKTRRAQKHMKKWMPDSSCDEEYKMMLWCIYIVLVHVSEAKSREERTELFLWAKEGGRVSTSWGSS